MLCVLHNTNAGLSPLALLVGFNNKKNENKHKSKFIELATVPTTTHFKYVLNTTNFFFRKKNCSFDDIEKKLLGIENDTLLDVLIEKIRKMDYRNN